VNTDEFHPSNGAGQFALPPAAQPIGAIGCQPYDLDPAALLKGCETSLDNAPYPQRMAGK
jgi:hypothetical protein